MQLFNQFLFQGNVERTSTRTWARSCGYDPAKLFAKLFHDDILYLLSMHNLWKTRRAPTPLEYNNLPDAGKNKISYVNVTFLQIPIVIF